jgi:coenzyme F420-reducing hydrogenase delta subunit
MLRAFEMGADGVLIAGCGEQCARENTADWIYQRVAKVRKTLFQIGIEPERIQAFIPEHPDVDIGQDIDKFIEQIGEFNLASALKQEVKVDNS